MAAIYCERNTSRSLAIAVAAVAAVEQLVPMARQEAGVLFVTKQCLGRSRR
jgi:hypothetical protein